MSYSKIGSRGRTARLVARAEAVGSLLRPKAVTDAIEAMFGGMTTALRPQALATRALEVQALNKAADAEITRLVQRQIDAGLDVVTDGELRRPSFLSSFYDAADGLGNAETRFEVRDDQGNVVYAGYADPVVTGRLHKAASPLAEEAAFMRSITDYPFKVTIPAPSYFLSDFVPVPSNVYPHRQQLLEDVIAIERRLVSEAIGAGANWIQFDFPLYPALVDETYTAKLLKECGIANQAALLQIALAADTEITQSIPQDVTVGMHLCRGNLEGGFWSGSLAPLAERMFNTLPHDRFLFEWEDISREGDYQPIKYVPKGRIMAMGLVSTKKPQVESVDEIVRRLEEAARYLDINQLALTTQCGFASLCGDHLVQAEDAQWRKLEVIGKVADRVWGAR
jgi:5-methyltetrahydropteroyltriglutamate--homocysteine methyltransferase